MGKLPRGPRLPGASSGGRRRDSPGLSSGPVRKANHARNSNYAHDSRGEPPRTPPKNHVN